MRSVNSILKDYFLKPKGMIEWRDIPGYEGKYKISSHGDIISTTVKILNPSGLSFELTDKQKNRITISIKRTIQLAFIETERYKGAEIWAEFPHNSLRGIYMVSNYGQLKSIRTINLTISNWKVSLLKQKNNKRNCVNYSVLTIYANCFLIR